MWVHTLNNTHSLAKRFNAIYVQHQSGALPSEKYITNITNFSLILIKAGFLKDSPTALLYRFYNQIDHGRITLRNYMVVGIQYSTRAIIRQEIYAFPTKTIRLPYDNISRQFLQPGSSIIIPVVMMINRTGVNSRSGGLCS